MEEDIYKHIKLLCMEEDLYKHIKLLYRLITLLGVSMSIVTVSLIIHLLGG